MKVLLSEIEEHPVRLFTCFGYRYAAAKEYGVSKFVYVPLWQSLGALKNKLYRLKVKEPTYTDEFVMSWNAFLASASAVGEIVPAKYEKDKCTVIGHTGGTTGTPKGVMLSDYAFNSIPTQEKWGFHYLPHEKHMDMVVPFAVYGLSNNLHIALSIGMNVILIPKVAPEKTDELLQKYKPNHITSIPNYWTAIPRSKRLKDELAGLADALAAGRDIRFSESLAKHADWAEELNTRYIFMAENALDILKDGWARGSSRFWSMPGYISAPSRKRQHFCSSRIACDKSGPDGGF